MSRPFTNSVARSLYSSTSKHNVQPSNTRANPPTNPIIPAEEPSTPTSQYPSPLPSTPLSVEQTPTGRWAHPAVAKITKLQSRKAPNETTLRRIMINLAALYIMRKISLYVHEVAFLKTVVQERYIDWTFYASYLLLAYNIAESARRFWWTLNYDDPTLTDRQRKLLNLPASPAANAATPPAALTPPRYQKAFTPSPSSQSSPLSGRRSSYGTYSPTSRLGGQSPLGAARSNALLSHSPAARSVSLSTTRGPTASSAVTQSPGADSSGADFSGSTRWKYNQNRHSSSISSHSFF